MRNIKLEIAYLGTNYRGMQSQPGGGTIQDVLEEFLSQVCGEKVRISASGRTDAGVHALCQVISFKTNGIIPCQNILRVAGSLLPADIAVLSAIEMPERFHARFSAKSKEYIYKISILPGPNPFLYDRCWMLGKKLNLAKMNEAAKLLIGEKDFAAFCSTGSDSISTIRRVDRAEFSQDGDMVIFDILANGFLYHMVRNLVWSLVQVGLGKRTVTDFQKELNSPRNAFLSSPAPAGGLYLKRVNYE